MNDWNAALPQNTTFTKVSSPTGAYPGYFLGFTDTWMSDNNCYNCAGKPGNADCKKCKGNGRVSETMIALKYDLGDGRTEQEQMTFKISPPRQVNGQAVRSSKLYERLVELSGLREGGPGDLGRWGTENKDCRVPCLIIIKQPGNYAKITEVVARQETANPAPTVRGLDVEPPEVRAARSLAFQAQQSGKEPNQADSDLFDAFDPEYK